MGGLKTYEVEIEILKTCTVKAQSKEEAVLLAKLKHQHMGEIVSAVAEETEEENARQA